ncbi:MAG: hypothetical protein ACRC2Y_04315 [Aeromonas veronii]
MARAKKEVVSTWEGLKEIPKGAVGFVYEITNLDTNQKYIGMKGFYATKAGKKVESNWKVYQGSNQLVADWGNVKKEVLRVCSTKTEMSYFEIHYLIHRQALLKTQYMNFMMGSNHIGRIPNNLLITE